MKFQKILRILSENEFGWRRVDDLPCVHVFYKDYFINLSLWHPHGVKTITIIVDDINRNICNILSVDLTASHEEFENLVKMYLEAKSSAENIAA